jgi:tetratricopeptide (TPR) repeat protein
MCQFPLRVNAPTYATESSRVRRPAGAARRLSAVPKPIRQVKSKRRGADPLRSAWHILEEWVEANRRPIAVITGIALFAALAFGIIYYFTEYRNNKALAAFNEAYTKFTATVGTSPPTPGLPAANKVTYPDNETKYREAGAAFEKLADGYSAYDDVGRYYAGLSYLEVEADKGLKLLEEVATSASDAEVKNQARLALAERSARDGQFERAETLYQQLIDEPGALPPAYLKGRLALVKERLGKSAEAASLYRQVVDADRDSPAGIDAEKGLQRVDPKQAAALPPKTPAGPGGVAPHSTSNQAPPGMGF